MRGLRHHKLRDVRRLQRSIDTRCLSKISCGLIGDAAELMVPTLEDRRLLEQTMGLCPPTTANEIDLRNLSSTQRHNNVFQLACGLGVGTSFVFVTDRDPEALYDQLQTEHRHEFFWNYLDAAPRLWRVQIGRLQKAH
jgi:uncharacterized protein (DUF2249 family)